MNEDRSSPFRDAHTDIKTAHGVPETEQTRSSAYRLAFADNEVLCRDELRPVRLQLELLKPQMLLDEYGVESTVVLFGGARIPAPDKAAAASNRKLADLSRYYDEARRFAYLVTQASLESGGHRNIITTGGGPGVMEAGNRGAREAGGISIGLNIVLPHEQAPNEYVTPDLCFNFHYFAIRKMHFLMRAKALVAFPGGFGTMDEVFEVLTLVQTGKVPKLPIVLFGLEFWNRAVDFDYLVAEGMISPQDRQLFTLVETADQAIAALLDFYHGQPPDAPQNDPEGVA